MKPNSTTKLTWREKICYGFGDCGANFTATLATTFLTGFYTDTVGISAAAVGTMLMFGRIFDGITDLFMGAVVDRTKSKYGKARPWLLWTAPFMSLALILMFNVPSSLGASGKLIYAYLTYIFQGCFVYTANNLPYNALLARMTLDVQERASASSLRFVMAQITGLLTNIATSTLLGTLGWFWLSIIYAVLTFVLLILSFLGVKEHIGSSKEEETDIVPLKTAIPAVLKNKYFYLQSLMFLSLYIHIVSIASMSYYFCSSVLQNVAMVSLVSTAGTIPAIVVNLVLPNFVKKFGKRRLMIVGSVLMILGNLIVGAAGTNITLIFAGILIKGFGQGPIMSCIFAMTADVVDYGEWKTGIRSEGLVNSCTSFGMKIGVGVGSVVCTSILNAGGYLGTAATQTDAAINMIRFGFGYNGAILSAILLILIIFTNIDKDIVNIQKELELRHAQ